MNKIELEKWLKDNKGNCASVLYSGKKGKHFLAANPSAELKTESITELKKFQKKHQDKLLIGYIAYDTVYELLNIKRTTKETLKIPKVLFRAYTDWQEVESSLESKETESNTEKSRANTTDEQLKKFTPNLSKKEYEKGFKKIKNYIKDGDIYQVNYCQKLKAKTKLKGDEIFMNAARTNKVDHFAYIDSEDFQIISASPERFIRIKGGQIETKPIKGTRPRGATAELDKELLQDLINSPKEAAELNMITDLLRNDIGKVSKPGSVKLKEHRAIQECATVWHTYSHISGELKLPALDAVISMLPGGSITGCPKKRATEIIDEIEPCNRGVYTGVLGYIHPNGELDFSIVIRTIVKIGDTVYLQVGGGIVDDSKMEEEYEETFNKAKSLIHTI